MLALRKMRMQHSLTLERLPERAQLAEWLGAAGLDEELPAVMAAYDSGALAAPANLAALRTCYQKAWLDGTRLAPEDLAGCTLDRLLLANILLALLVPLLQARHKALGMPESVTAESCRGLGHSARVMSAFPDALWRSLHWTGKYHREIMFKTGLFVYLVETMSEKLPVWAFRSRVDGAVVALAGDGARVDEAGLICADEASPAFVTHFERTAEAFAGHRVDPHGRITRECLTLSAADWETILGPGMVSAGIHIPPGRPMCSADCAASLRAAADVIRDCLGHLGIKCFTCLSWILNPDWLELLPDSNMAQFMREVYLFPIKSPPTAGIDFVFRQPAAELDLKTAPRKSRLQRIMLEHLEQKQPLHAGGMFLPLEDVKHFGTQHFASRFAGANGLAKAAF